ncbi:hypothetical protein ORL93_12340 [Bacillus sp. DHT2]|uniref:hypothetical protein n=1 Tax=Bacillus sp. DHT2 TaxID=2994532 RepID=UPI0022496B41|nr:hypothetical protein [Bacillus sp. DHT2]MCX2826562.1 hypothetical protein [Bacillus sp. DHT2]
MTIYKLETLPNKGETKQLNCMDGDAIVFPFEGSDVKVLSHGEWTTCKHNSDKNLQGFIVHYGMTHVALPNDSFLSIKVRGGTLFIENLIKYFEGESTK